MSEEARDQNKTEAVDKGSDAGKQQHGKVTERTVSFADDFDDRQFSAGTQMLHRLNDRGNEQKVEGTSVKFVVDSNTVVRGGSEPLRSTVDRNSLQKTLHKFSSTRAWTQENDSSCDEEEELGARNYVRRNYGQGLAVDRTFSVDDAEEWKNSPTTHTIRSEWLEGVCWDFLDEMDLDLSDDEPEFKKQDLIDYDQVFFKYFDTLRKSKLVLNSQLPRLDHQGKIRAMFKSHGTQIRTIAKAVQKCHKWAHLLFNFQRHCMMVCSESAYNTSAENEDKAKEVSVDFDSNHKDKMSFKVDSYSVINCLCLWGFSAFWDGDSDFHAVTELSPYLSLTSQQWKEALKTDHPARNIMLYEPAGVRSLRKQGTAAIHRAEKLEEIHNTTKFFKLVLAEYINGNKESLKNGCTIRGSDIVQDLQKDRKNWELFTAMPKLDEYIRHCEFLLNPCISQIDLIPTEICYSEHKEKHTKRIIFLCDPLHWTLYVQELLHLRVDAMISVLAKTAEVKEQQGFNTEFEAQIKNVETLAKEHVSKLRQIVKILPDSKDVKKFLSQSKARYLDGMTVDDSVGGSSRRSKSVSGSSKSMKFSPLHRKHESVRVFNSSKVIL